MAQILLFSFENVKFVTFSIISLIYIVFTVESQQILMAPMDTMTSDKTWRCAAIQKMWKEREKMTKTPLFKFKYPSQPHVQIVFKNESAAITHSLKHRYAWMLTMWALVEGNIDNGTTVVEASSGNTATSLGYMCRQIGVPFTVIVPDTIEPIKQRHIESQGAKIIKVPIGERSAEGADFANGLVECRSRKIMADFRFTFFPFFNFYTKEKLERAQQHTEEVRGFFMNQFGNADRAEEYHESGEYHFESANLYHELITQLQEIETEEVKIPNYFVHSAGTGGTISSVGRYARKYGLETQIVLADTQYSVYADVILNNKFTNESGASLWVKPGLAGIGYGPLGAVKKGKTSSLDRNVIDRVVKIPDIASTAAMAVLRSQGISGGTSSGINFLTALHIAAMSNKSQPATIATILGDPGYFYDGSYYNTTWIEKNFASHGGLRAYECWKEVIDRSLQEPIDPLFTGYHECGNNDDGFRH